MSLGLSTYYLDLSHFELPKDGSNSNHHKMVLNNAFNNPAENVFSFSYKKNISPKKLKQLKFKFS